MFYKEHPSCSRAGNGNDPIILRPTPFGGRLVWLHVPMEAGLPTAIASRLSLPLIVEPMFSVFGVELVPTVCPIGSDWRSSDHQSPVGREARSLANLL